MKLVISCLFLVLVGCGGGDESKTPAGVSDKPGTAAGDATAAAADAGTPPATPATK